MPPLVVIPYDLLASALDTPSRISRFCLRAMPRFDLPLGVPDSGTREQLSNPISGPVRVLSRFHWRSALNLPCGGKKRRCGLSSCLLGVPFQERAGWNL
jgi:hypothetical protein